MRVHPCNRQKPEHGPDIFTWDEMHQEEGVYRLAFSTTSNSYVRFVTLRLKTTGLAMVLWVPSCGTHIAPANPSTWSGRHFKKVDEKVCFEIVPA